MIEIVSDKDWEKFRDTKGFKVLLVTKQACGVCRQMKNSFNKRPLSNGIPAFTVNKFDIESLVNNLSIKAFPSFCIFKG